MKRQKLLSLLYASLSTALIYEILLRQMYSLAFVTVQGDITNVQREQLPTDLIAQMLGHCTGITEVRDSIP